MNGKYYIGTRVSDFERYNDEGPVAGVRVLVDNDNAYVAGDQTGYVMEVECPYGTQEMADNLLSSLSGITYKGYRANAAVLSPEAELGDGVDVNGLYSVLAYRKVEFGPGHMSEVAAPGDNEAEHEYEYTPQSQKELDYQLAQARSLIQKTSEEILLQVESVSGEVNSLAVTLDGVTITGPSGETLIKGSSIETGSLTVEAANITGTLTASQIDATDLKVSAANITGSLTIGQLPSDVATDSEIPKYTSQLTNNSGYQTESGVVSIVNGTVTADYVTALGISATKLQGEYVYLYSSSSGVSGVIHITSASSSNFAVDITSLAALRLTASSGDVYIKNGYGNYIDITSGGTSFNSNIWSEGVQYCGTSAKPWSAVYAQTGEIQTSDANRKCDIEALPDKYLNFMDLVTPRRFRMKDGTSGRYHTGFIAQEVKEAMDAAGIDPLEFGGWCKDVDEDGNDVYMLRYEEFIAILWAKIKELEAKIDDKSAV